MAYSPASMTSVSAGLSHGQSVFYNKTALKNVYANAIFDRPATDFTLPTGSGKTVQMFRYDLLGTNTTPTAAEGTVGTGISTVKSRILECSVAQYDDFISTSDFNISTAIDPVMENYARLLGIQAGLSVDTIIRATLDGEAANMAITPTGVSFNKKDLGLIRAKLSGANVRPNPAGGGAYLVFLHPNITYDLTNDPTAGGWIDVTKTADPQMAMLKKMDFQGVIGTLNGCKLVETTNGYSSGTTYRTYAFGEDCMGIVNLAGKGPNPTADPANFKINMVRGGQPSIYDPTGVIGGIVSYKFYFGTCLLGGPAQIGDVFRARTLDTVTTVT